MRFLGKYELLEQLTVGTVETFAAYPIGGGERLLVHLFALPALLKAELTNRDLVDYLQKLSPPILASVRDAGRYDDGTQAYIVTKFPRDLNLLAEWVASYKLTSRTKHDTTADGTPPDLWERKNASTHADRAAERPRGDFTRAFKAAGSDPIKPAPTTDPFGPPRPSAGSIPEDPIFGSEPRGTPAAGSLTEQFMSGLGEGAQLPPSRPSFGAEKSFDTRRPSAPPRVAPSDSWVTPHSPGSSEDEHKDGAQAGEFTRFFAGPFAAPPPNPQAVLMPEPLLQPSPPKGDFTNLFGSAQPGGGMSRMPPEPLLEPPVQAERGSFTDVFQEAQPAGSHRPPDEPLTTDEPAAFQVRQSEASTGYVSLQNTNFPPVRQTNRDAGQPVFSSSTALGSPIFSSGQDEGATRVFKTQTHEEASVAPPPVVPGESEYTRIIRGPKPEPAEPAAKAPEPETPFAGGAVKIQMPAPPVISIGSPVVSAAAPRVAMPPVHLPPPPSPVLSVKAPTIPAVSAGNKLSAGNKKKNAAKWTSYIPLIVILNLLLLAAVGLVLFFIFKH